MADSKENFSLVHSSCPGLILGKFCNFLSYNRRLGEFEINNVCTENYISCQRYRSRAQSSAKVNDELDVLDLEDFVGPLDPPTAPTIGNMTSTYALFGRNT